MAKGFLKGALAGAALFGAACALTAPRPASYERQRMWEYLRRFRYAHRGLHDLSRSIPENSLSAFERAAELGFGSELDVHLTADKRLVVVHDSHLARLTGVDAVVEERTFDELSALRLLGTNERIPLFSEVLDVYERRAPRTPLIVEIKTQGENHAAITAAVMAELDARKLVTCIESFDPRVATWLRFNRGDVFRGQLAQNFLRRGRRSGRGVPFDLAASMLAGNALARPDFVAYRFEDAWMPSNLLATRIMRAAFVGWTLHSEAELIACERAGGIGIFEGFIPDPRGSAYRND